MLHIEKGDMMGHGHISPNTQTTKSTTTSNEVSYTAEGGFTKKTILSEFGVSLDAEIIQISLIKF